MNKFARTLLTRPTKSFFTAVRHNHVGIIGCGSVGISCANSLIHKSSVKTISIYDLNTAKCGGEVLDLEDEAFLSNTKIQHAKIEDLRACDIIIITAGVALKPGQTRLDILPTTGAIMKNVMTSLQPLKKEAIVLVVSNPVDILAAYVQDLSKEILPANQVIGSGTYLDTQRLRVALSKKLNTKPSAVHAYVLGEHGDSQVAPESLVRVGGCSTSELGLPSSEFQTLASAAAKKAYTIAAGKGHTSHGIGECAATICDAIFSDRKDIIVVSTFHPAYGVYLGWPCIIGRGGVEKLMPLSLEPVDAAAVTKSAEVLKNTYGFLGDKK